MRCGWCQSLIADSAATICVACHKAVASILPPDSTLQDGRYTIEKTLGQGGFGITYKGWDARFKRHIAIKEFYPASYVHRDLRTQDMTYDSASLSHVTSGIQYFLREGQNLASIHHPGIPIVYDHFEEHKTAYLIMEFISGQSLEALLRARPDGIVPETQIRDIIGPLVDALATIHTRGLYHLDIKPDNIMLEDNGRVVLIDFGASREGDSFGTRSVPALTPRYAPPELFLRDTYGPETDIFELGMLLHRLRTGELPPSAMDRQYSKREWQPDPERLGEPWHTLVQSALPLEYQKRPQDIRKWWNACAKATTGERLSKKQKYGLHSKVISRRPLISMGLTLFGVATISGLTVFFSTRKDTTPPKTADADNRSKVPQTSQPLLGKAVQLESVHQYPEAIAECTHVIAQNPDMVEGFVLRGRCYLASGDFERAIADLSASLIRSPTNREALFYRSQALIGLGKYADAAADYITAATIAKSDSPSEEISWLKAIRDEKQADRYTLSYLLWKLFEGRLVTSKDDGRSLPLPDVPTDSMFYQSVEFVLRNGLLIGLPMGMFRGETILRRKDTVLTLDRLVMRLKAGNSASLNVDTVGDISGGAIRFDAPFPQDIPTDHWCYAAAARLSAEKLLIVSRDGKFHMEQPVSVGELRLWLRRLLRATSASASPRN